MNTVLERNLFDEYGFYKEKLIWWIRFYKEKMLPFPFSASLSFHLQPEMEITFLFFFVIFYFVLAFNLFYHLGLWRYPFACQIITHCWFWNLHTVVIWHNLGGHLEHLEHLHHSLFVLLYWAKYKVSSESFIIFYEYEIQIS